MVVRTVVVVIEAIVDIVVGADVAVVGSIVIGFIVVGFIVVGFIVVGFIVIGFIVIGFIVIGFIVVGLIVVGFIVVKSIEFRSIVVGSVIVDVVVVVVDDPVNPTTSDIETVMVARIIAIPMILDFFDIPIIIIAILMIIKIYNMKHKKILR